MAEEVRKKYWRSQTVPVNIDHIVEYGVRLDVIPIDELRAELDIYGFLSNDRTTMFVDSNMMVTQKYEAALRFTVAHELGHYFLHQEFYEANKINTAKEWKVLLGQIDGANLVSYEEQADEFAGRLLVPLEQLHLELSLLAPHLADLRTRNESIRDQSHLYSQVFGIIIAERLAPKFNVPFEVMQQRLLREKINPLDYVSKNPVQRN